VKVVAKVPPDRLRDLASRGLLGAAPWASPSSARGLHVATLCSLAEPESEEHEAEMLINVSQPEECGLRSWKTAGWRAHIERTSQDNYVGKFIGPGRQSGAEHPGGVRRCGDATASCTSAI